MYGILKGGWGGGVVYRAIVVQKDRKSAGSADGEGKETNGSLVHKSFEVKE